MYLPVVTCAREITVLSHDITRRERELYRRRYIITEMDDLIRQTTGLASDALTAMVRAIQKGRKHRFKSEEIQSRMHKRLDKVRDDYLANYTSLLSAREAIVVGQELVTLDEKSRANLFEAFKDKVIDQLKSFHDEVEEIKPFTNLEILELQLDDRNEEKKKASEELHEKKTALTSETLNLEDVYREEIEELERVKAKLFADLETPLSIFLAAQIGDLDFIKTHVEKLWPWQREKFVNQTMDHQFTPLHIAAWHKHHKIVKYLLEKGANPEAKNEFGYLALHFAAKAGSGKVVSCLLEHKRSAHFINALGEYGRTPLHLATFNARVKVTALLIEHGADINAKASEEDCGVTPLHEAVCKGLVNVVKTLTSYASLDVMIPDEKEHCPLFYAIMHGFSDVVECLLKHPSWKNPENASDPNSLDELLKITPPQNAEKIKFLLLNHYPATHY